MMSRKTQATIDYVLSNFSISLAADAGTENRIYLISFIPSYPSLSSTPLARVSSLLLLRQTLEGTNPRETNPREPNPRVDKS